MAEGDSKMFGQYQGSRINPVPEGFLGAYAQVSKNIADTGAQVGKGIGDLITGYQAARAKEDALNEQTKSPVFLQGLNTALSGVAAKKAAILKNLKDQGFDPDVSPNEPPSDEIQQQLALLASYEGVEKEGMAFLKDPSKLDNKKKLQLIGSVTSVNALFEKEKTAATEAAAAVNKGKAAEADLTVKTLAANKARTDAINTALAAVRPEAKEAKSIVSSVINSAGARTPESARQRLEILANEIKTADDAARRGIGYGPTRTQEIEFEVLNRYIQDKANPTTETGWGAEEDRSFMSPEAAQERVEALDKEIDAALKEGRDVTGLTAMRNDLQMELDVSGDLGFVYTGNFDTAEQIYNKGQALARNYRSALGHLQQLAAEQNKTGGIFIPEMNEQDKQSLLRMVAHGTNDVEDLSTGMRYRISESGELEEVPLSKDDVERLSRGAGVTTEEKKAAEQLKALQLSAQTTQRQFGKVNVTTANVLKDPKNPSAGHHVVRQYNAVQYEPVVTVANHPELTIHVAGIAAGDGTSTNKNIIDMRQSLVEDNKVLNALARAQTILKGPNGVIKETLTEPEKAAFAAEVFEVKRGLGKGLGPLSASDYQLINSKITTPLPVGSINVSSPTFVRDLIQSEFWEDYTRSPQAYYDGLTRIMNARVSEIKSAFRGGIGITAVDDQYQKVDGNFLVRSGLFMDDDGKFNTVIMNRRDNQPIYMADATEALKARPVAIGATRNAEIAKGKQAAVAFDAAIYSESMADPMLAIAYQDFIRANSMLGALGTADKNSDAYKKWLAEEYEPTWAYLSKYLLSQGIPQDVLNGYQFHLGLNPKAL